MLLQGLKGYYSYYWLLLVIHGLLLVTYGLLLVTHGYYWLLKDTSINYVTAATTFATVTAVNNVTTVTTALFGC